MEDRKKFSALTERQRTAYTLRQQKMTYEKIGKEMGISTNAAREHIRHAERRFREYDRYHDKRRRNNIPVDFPMTRGELLLTLSALPLLEAELQKGVKYRPDSDWLGSLPYTYDLVRSLENRLRQTLYGQKSAESDGKEEARIPELQKNEENEHESVQP